MQNQSRLESNLKSAMLELESIEEKLEALDLVAPVDGFVMPVWLDQQPEYESDKLAKWYGETLHAENESMVFQRGQPICRISKTKDVNAKLVIDQADIRDVDEGQQVKLLLDSSANEVLRGTLTSLSQQNSDFLTARHFMKFGGNMEEAPGQGIGGDDDASVESFEEHVKSGRAVFEGIVVLNGIPENVRTGQKGFARVFVGHRTILSKFTKFIYRTFRFDV